jgi:murein DD-endopeptidase MepM/ murein hydrolase activator NlpD
MSTITTTMFRIGDEAAQGMQAYEETIAGLGNEPPLIADGRGGPPDRREVSARWLTGTFLTGLTSTVLMGVALVVALDGREQLATPPEIADMALVPRSEKGGESAKTVRLVPPRQIVRAKNRRRMEVSMMSRVGDRNVVRTLPFVRVNMALGAGHKTTASYPPFDPLDVFAEDRDAAPQTASSVPTGEIYGSKVESEMILRTIDFPIDTAAFDERNDLSSAEVEEVVRTVAGDLSEGAIQVAALHYVDPQRFGDSLAAQALTASYGVRIVPENVSVAPRESMEEDVVSFAEELIPFAREGDLSKAFEDAGYTGDESRLLADALAARLGSSEIRPGSVLRVGLEVLGAQARMVRLGLYDGTRHIATFGLDDRRRAVAMAEPDPNPNMASAFDDTPPVQPRANMPTAYDGIYQAAYAYGMSNGMTRQIIKLLASDVDFQSRLSPSDRLQVLFSQPDDDDQVSDQSELLYLLAGIGGHDREFFRFAMEDGSVDYFDEEGRSARQFLLRNPLPNGKFRSGFGGRRHPILGYTRMHTGVDWSAPRGSPIIAAGNGVVEKAGWAGGYGRQTVIRHANGYESSYNHQSAIAKDVVPGARVRQGQVIGYVGSTGLSTGNHLHYELIVNGRKVDPMRVRLPVGRILKGEELERFKVDRDRIRKLLEDEQGSQLKMASAR